MKLTIINSDKDTEETFNRTGKELKQTKEAWENLMLLNTFNRTGKELKLKLPEIAEKKIEPFNRTGKELKPSIVFL